MRNDMPTEQENTDKTNEDDADDDIGKNSPIPCTIPKTIL